MKRGTAAASLALIVALGGALRLSHALAVGGRYTPHVDQEEGYYEAGVTELSCHSLGLIANTEPTDYLAPIYPSFLALAESFFALPSPGHARIAKALLSTLAVAAAGLLGWFLFSPLAGVLAGALLAFNVNDVLEVSSLNVHGFYGSALLALGIALVLWLEKRDVRRAALLGLMIAATLLCRPANFPFPPLFAAACLWRWKFPEGGRRALLPVAAATALFLAPMALRNGLQFGSWWPFDSKGAFILVRSAAGPYVETTVEEALDTAEAIEPGFKARGLEGRALYNAMMGLAVKQIRREPLAYAGYCLQRLYLFWRGLWLYLALGLYALWRRRGDRGLEALVLTAASLSGYGLAGGVPPYRVSAVPLLCVIAAAGLASLPFAAKAAAEPAGVERRRLRAGAAVLAGAFAVVYAATLLFLALELREHPRSAPVAAQADPCPDGRAAHLLKLAALQEGGRGPGATDYLNLLRARPAGIPLEPVGLTRDYWLEKAAYLAQTNAPDAARSALLRAEASEPDDAALRRIAALRRDLKDHARAAAALEKLLARRPGDAAARLEAVGLYRERKLYRRALDALSPLLRLRPRDAALWLERAELEELAGSREASAASLARAVELGGLADEQGARVFALYRARGDRGRALDQLTRLLARPAADAGLWLERAELESRAGAHGAALESLARAMALEPGEDGRLRAVGLYSGLKRHREALAALKPLLERRPRDAELWLRRAELETRAGEPAAASSSSARVEELGAASDDQRRRLAGILRELKEDRRALAQLRLLLERSPRDAELWLARAEAEARVGERGAALASLTRAGELPLSGERRLRLAGLWLERAEAEARAGERDSALRSLARAEAASPDEDGRRRAALLYRLLKESRRSLALLKPLLEARPRDAGLWVARAELEAETGDERAALESLSRAEEAKPDEDGRRRMALLYRRLEEPARALSLVESLLEGRPGDAELWLERAELEASKKGKEAALSSLARAGQAEPGGELGRRLALDYQNLGEHARALAVLDGLIRREPREGAYYSDRGLCRYLKGDAAGAVADLETAIKLTPKFLPAYLSLGAVHSAGGRFARALAVYEEGLARAAEDEPLRGALTSARAEILSKGRAE